MKAMRRIVFILLAALLIQIAGCGTSEGAQPDSVSHSAEPPVVTQSAQSDLGEASLLSLRQSMEGTAQLFAVAYFGYCEPADDNQSADAFAVMTERAPKLCKELPFLQDIPKENVVGQWGDLFCIVPLDPNATVAVSKGCWDYDNFQYVYDDLLYSSDGGEPILLFCNNAGWEPDTELYISGDSGETFWYPQTDVNGCADPLRNDDWDELFLDFSPYRELLAATHRSLTESGWVMPTEDMLVGSTWSRAYYLKDDREVLYEVCFQEDTLSVRWNDGIDEEDHVYPDAAWELTYEGGFAILSIDFREFAGVLRYNLLYNEELQELYTAMDAVQQDLPIGWEPLSRVLGYTPNAADMVGTWVLDWTEIEGETIPANPNSQMITIAHNHDNLYWIDYTDYEYPDDSYLGKELEVCHERLHYNCGNDSWAARVNYIGENGVEHWLTLLPDGSMLLQNYWELDGAPTVSYGSYHKTDG